MNTLLKIVQAKKIINTITNGRLGKYIVKIDENMRCIKYIS